MNNKVLALIIGGVVILLLAIIMILVPASTDAPIGGEQPRFCTEDAKICPDGSAVGRTGPNCEFAKCPGE